MKLFSSDEGFEDQRRSLLKRQHGAWVALHWFTMISTVTMVGLFIFVLISASPSSVATAIVVLPLLVFQVDVSRKVAHRIFVLNATLSDSFVEVRRNVLKVTTRNGLKETDQQLIVDFISESIREVQVDGQSYQVKQGRLATPLKVMAETKADAVLSGLVSLDSSQQQPEEHRSVAYRAAAPRSGAADGLVRLVAEGFFENLESVALYSTPGKSIVLKTKDRWSRISEQDRQQLDVLLTNGVINYYMVDGVLYRTQKPSKISKISPVERNDRARLISR